jgi:hypothetical protein
VSMLGMADARLIREGARRRTRRENPAISERARMPERASLSDSLRPAEGRPDRPPGQADEGFQGIGNQLVRYIPTELIGAYIFFLSVLTPIATPNSCGADFSSHWIALLAFTTSAPILEWLIYKARARQVGEKGSIPWFECSVCGVAFFAWAIALPGSPMFSFCGWKAGYGAFIAGAVAIMLPLISAAFGLSLADDRKANN